VFAKLLSWNEAIVNFLLTVVFPLLVLRLHPTQVFCITEMINSHMTVIPYRINLQCKTPTKPLQPMTFVLLDRSGVGELLVWEAKPRGKEAVQA
jgi:hypothetical protein